MINLFHNLLLCILEFLKIGAMNDFIIKNLATVQEIQYSVVQPQTRGSVLNIKKRNSQVRLSRTSSTNLSSQRVKSPQRSEEDPPKESTISSSTRISLLQILIYLYSHITEENIEPLIRNTVRIMNAICRQKTGSENLLSELQRTDRNNRKSNYLGNNPQTHTFTKSEGSTRMSLRTAEPILKINNECFFLLPLINPIKKSKGNFDVRKFFCFFDFFFKTK